MKKLMALPIILAAAACTAEPPGEASAQVQMQLDDALRGRVAGRPQSCVQLRELRGNRSVGDEAIIFETDNRDLFYLNRPAGGCPAVTPGRALKIDTPTGQLCSGEIVDVIDTSTGMGYGGCGLGEFVPYRRER